jgi:hypothetical protein
MHVGFDYGLSPRELAKKLVEGAIVIAEKSAVVKFPAMKETGLDLLSDH